MVADYRLEGDLLLPEGFGVPFPPFDGGQTLSTEIYLELHIVDLDDPEDILRFVNKYGTLGIAFAGFDMFRGLGCYTDEIERSVLAGLQLPHRKGNTLRDFRLGAHERGDYRVETLAGFRLGAKTIRDTRTAYLVANGNLELADAEWLSPMTLLAPPKSEPAAALLLPSYLEYPLTLFPPHIEVRAVDARGEVFRPTLEFAKTLLPLYAVCMLELFNHIVEDARYRTCPICSRPFVRHQGVAKVGQHRRRSGVKFCSVECNRISAQREYRRRAREKRGL